MNLPEWRIRLIGVCFYVIAYCLVRITGGNGNTYLLVVGTWFGMGLAIRIFSRVSLMIRRRRSIGRV